MSLESVKNAVKGTVLENAIISLPHTGATVELAADAVGCTPDEIAKTLSFLVDEQPVLIVVSGSARVDNKKYKAYFHKKAKMIPWDAVEDYTGHLPGGVCPFGAKETVQIYVDRSLEKHEIVYPAAGDENYVIRTPVSEIDRLVPVTAHIDVTQQSEESRLL